MSTSWFGLGSAVAQWLLGLAGWEILFSTILFVLVWLVGRLLPPRHCRLRHLLWGLVLLRLVLPPDLAAPWSVGSLVAGSVPEVGRVAAGPAESTFNVPPVAALEAGREMAGSGWAPAAELVRLGAAAVWALGALAVAAVLSRRRRLFRRIASRAAPAAQPDLVARLEWWRSRMGVRRPVRLVLSDDVRTPFTLGSLRPIVVLPRSVARLSGSAFVDCAIGHEMAHVRRWDDLWLQCQSVITALYFFLPIAWLAARYMREAAELASDQLVLARGGLRPRAYGRALLEFLKPRPPACVAAAPALVAASHPATRRFEAIMQASFASSRPAVSWTAALLVAFLILPMAAGEAPDASGLAQQDVVLRAQQPSFVHPLPGAAITARHGIEIRHLVTGVMRVHHGVDLAAPQGTDVAAAAAGTVEAATDNYREEPARGLVVVVDHGEGYKTYYGHLESIAVTLGQSVVSGDMIGTVGSTGLSTGPHLHFEIWQDGESVEPGRFITELKRWVRVGGLDSQR